MAAVVCTLSAYIWANSDVDEAYYCQHTGAAHDVSASFYSPSIHITHPNRILTEHYSISHMNTNMRNSKSAPKSAKKSSNYPIDHSRMCYFITGRILALLALTMRVETITNNLPKLGDA